MKEIAKFDTNSRNGKGSVHNLSSALSPYIIRMYLTQPYSDHDLKVNRRFLNTFATDKIYVYVEPILYNQILVTGISRRDA